jgi:hypothetical protein
MNLLKAGHHVELPRLKLFAARSGIGSDAVDIRST